MDPRRRVSILGNRSSIDPTFMRVMTDSMRGSRNFWKGGGLQPLITTFVYHSVRKGGVAALKMAKNDLFLVKFFDERGGGVATPATLPLDPPMDSKQTLPGRLLEVFAWHAMSRVYGIVRIINLNTLITPPVCYIGYFAYIILDAILFCILSESVNISFPVRERIKSYFPKVYLQLIQDLIGMEMMVVLRL